MHAQSEPLRVDNKQNRRVEEYWSSKLFGIVANNLIICPYRYLTKFNIHVIYPGKEYPAQCSLREIPLSVYRVRGKTPLLLPSFFFYLCSYIPLVPRFHFRSHHKNTLWDLTLLSFDKQYLMFSPFVPVFKNSYTALNIANLGKPV